MRWILFPSLVFGAACASEQAPTAEPSPGVLDGDPAFVPISRSLSDDIATTRMGLSLESVPAADAKESFYIAINKKELNQRYFLSGYLKQMHPGGAGAAPTGQSGVGAARSFGTRVVTFRVQNGKLFVFDAQDGLASSDTFDPSLVIEAYPIVETYAPFAGLPGHDKYVLFDPAAGLNRFGVVSDRFATGNLPRHFQVDLSFMQNFRRIEDGTTFEQVFTGWVGETFWAPPETTDFFKASGTLGIALRRYREGEGFQPFDANTTKREYYFRAPDLLEKNTGRTLSRAAKWNIHPGMKPIRWLISDQFVKLGKENPKYDVVGAIRAGIENWNEVFGFRALEAVVASPEDSFGDDDKNYFIFDADPSLRGAFANWRINPNTGEVRGASVYFSSFWFYQAITELDPANAARAAASSAAPTPSAVGWTAPEPKREAPAITWGDFRDTPLCDMFVPDALEGRVAREVGARAVERFVTHIASHEIGHTLGLRHNFKGSLQQQSSVMEYLLTPDAVEANRDHPGPYDADAIRLLYGLSTSEPTQAFCTDDTTLDDPNCTRRDRGDDPLPQYWGAQYKPGIARILKGQDAVGNRKIVPYLKGTASYLRAGTPADQERAWHLLHDQLALGVDHTADEAAYPGYIGRLSEVQRDLLGYLFRWDEPVGVPILENPVLTGTTLTQFATELGGTIANRDGYRGFDTRRIAVDVLKKVQAQPAYEALLAARAKVAEHRATLPPGTEAALTDDLLWRIDAATRPYFKE